MDFRTERTCPKFCSVKKMARIHTICLTEGKKLTTNKVYLLEVEVQKGRNGNQKASLGN